MFSFIQTLILRLFAQATLSQVEASLGALISKAEGVVEPQVKAELQLEITKVKALIVKYLPEAKSKLAAIEADIKKAEEVVASFFSAAEQDVKNIVGK